MLVPVSDVSNSMKDMVIIEHNLWKNTARRKGKKIDLGAAVMTSKLQILQALYLLRWLDCSIFHVFCYLYTNQEYLFMKQTCIMTFIILPIRLEHFCECKYSVR